MATWSDHNSRRCNDSGGNKALSWSRSMANREELAVIRGARSGDPACQLKLGQLYLFGGASLPRSMPTALHWLSRAAGQGQDAAWRLIGQHIAFDYAQHSRAAVLDWYVRAAEAGIHQAAITLAQLILL